MEVSMAERKTARELIETGLSDTERLISQKQYSLAMIKARQTLEYISRSLCRKSGLPEGELIDMVDDLYRKGIITRDSCTHYHKIRMLGEAALQNGDNNAYNASNAYQLLSQEVFAYRSVYSQRPKRGGSSAKKRNSSSGRRSSGPAFEPFDLLKILIPVLAIVLLFSIFRLVTADKKETTAAQTTEASQEAGSGSETSEVPTEAQETEAPGPVVTTVYIADKNLNVRTAPSTNADVVVTLPKDTQVDYVSAHNEEWSVINYNGAQAYVATRYLRTEERTE
jgi:hypothetical protein